MTIKTWRNFSLQFPSRPPCTVLSLCLSVCPLPFALPFALRFVFVCRMSTAAAAMAAAAAAITVASVAKWRRLLDCRLASSVSSFSLRLARHGRAGEGEGPQRTLHLHLWLGIIHYQAFCRLPRRIMRPDSVHCGNKPSPSPSPTPTPNSISVTCSQGWRAVNPRAFSLKVAWTGRD